ncbi:sugar ABC transporter substrate-binding protein [Planctomycetales bacterium ZRK34]|nr:sugar ABC transporter substrate-binding protein [Planctomycetales bacterium ZRK34]
MLIMLIVALTLIGCGDRSSKPAADNDNPTIALIMKSLANEFFSTMADGARDHQKAHADEYSLIVNGIKDERDLAQQMSIVEQMIAQQVDAIVIAPADSKALAPVLKRALEAGVVVVNIDNKLDDGVLEQSGIDIPFVGPDNRDGARKAGEHLAKTLKPGDEVAILEGVPTAFNGQQRRAGFEDALKAAELKIVAVQSGQWEMAKANSVAAAMLSEHPNLKAIAASNDSMALGAAAAIKAAGREGQVKVVGFDNISAVQQMIKDGKILATVDQHGDQLAVYGIEQALAMLKGQAAADDRQTPTDLITAESIK